MAERFRVALASVLERIDDACRRASRSPHTVRLVAVSKTMPAERIGRLVAAGHTLLGENRVQEALSKMADVGPDARWHLVGHLQRNKARQAVGRFELIHSVDRLELAQELDRRAAVAGVTQPILVQVNLALEQSKHGVGESELPRLLESIAPLASLALCGLMTIPPPVHRAEESRPWFSRLRELREQAAARIGRSLPELSMGMSDDFEVAVEEGATLVRVGRAIFGERPVQP